jgi:mannose-6-phosphate isomerase
MLYPLRFKEILRNYTFGNRWIVEAYAKEGLPDDHRVAETWEVCDRPPESSVVLNGPLAEETLHALIAAHGADLLGRDVVARWRDTLPLLIKFLDASNVLAEQAHHNDALAAKRGLSDPGKTEAWYMLKVRPGATIHCGQRDDAVTARSVHNALLAGSVRDEMREYAVQPGDAFLLHAGTMHYSKGGVFVLRDYGEFRCVHRFAAPRSDIARRRKGSARPGMRWKACIWNLGLRSKSRR